MSSPAGSMDPLLPLAVVVPLAAAACVAAANPVFRNRRRALDSIAILTAAATTAMLGVIMVSAEGRERVYWFGGVRPHHEIALGIDFAVSGLNGGLAMLAALLVTASMIFSWRYFERESTWYHSLMLVFLAGMVGFCLTGDIFDLFVWFEVMGVAAYALTAYRPEEKGPLQGAFNFAVTNSIGAYLTLSGIALVYARTGSLNMAEIADRLGHHRPGGIVIVAFVLIITGFLTKGAIVPFHFWLADAHAVAPTPVCVLFSGVMVELGLYGAARVYWSVFSSSLGHRGAVTAVMLALGTLTALVGALFCYRQRHLKRMLAFSTISHAGLFLMGFALLSPLGLAGAAVYVIGHGLVKAALFLCVGIVLHRLQSVDERALHGKGKGLRATGVIFVLAGLGLSDLPPFATYLGAGWVGTAGSTANMSFVTAVIMASSMLVGGTVLRVAGGVFYGLGDPMPEDTHMHEASSEETSETDSDKDHTPLTMILPAAVLVALAVAVGLIPGVGAAIERATVGFEDQAGYVKEVLRGGLVSSPSAPLAARGTGFSLASLITAIVTAVGALVVAGLALYRRRLPVIRKREQGGPDVRLLGFIEGLQSGIVNDYVTWLVLGVACVGGALAFSIH